MKIVDLGTGNKTEALAVLDQLRQEFAEGKIIGFASIGITVDDECYMYTGTSIKVSRLRIQGAIGQLSHSFMCDSQ